MITAIFLDFAWCLRMFFEKVLKMWKKFENGKRLRGKHQLFPGFLGRDAPWHARHAATYTSGAEFGHFLGRFTVESRFYSSGGCGDLHSTKLTENAPENSNGRFRWFISFWGKQPIFTGFCGTSRPILMVFTSKNGRNFHGYLLIYRRV